jgi:SOS-response transcriptional repressor LexA
MWLMQNESDHQLIKALVDWATNGNSSRVAKEIGVSVSTINRHYNGKASTRLGRDTIAKLREKYPMFPGWDNGGNSRVRSEVASFGDRPFEEKFGSGELPAIPVVGSAIAMRSFDPDRHIELVEVDMSDVLEYIARPLSLARDGQAYALTVVGDSMVPRFKPNRRIIVSPKAPVSIGDDVVVQLRGTVGDEEYRERVATVLLKELVKRTATSYLLRQYNPEVTFEVATERVAAMHKVIGEVY